MTRYDQVKNGLFKTNRSKLISNMENGTMAIFHSNDLLPKNADQHMPFKQNSDLFYLTGIDQEETALLIIKSESINKEVLFIKKTNDTIKVWEGEKLSKKQAANISGIELVMWNNEFEKILTQNLKLCHTVLLNSNEHPRANIVVETRDARFSKWIKAKFPTLNYDKVANILYPIRSVKMPEEINMIERACEITRGGVDRVLNYIKPGVYEFELEAEIIHEFLKNRSRGFAYEPIIASGKNACILHYNSNNSICQNGDLVLMDFGAEYGNYASDLTRCFPVSGVFTKRQKSVYNAVLRVMRGAISMLRPGTVLEDYEKNVGQLMERELYDLGLINKKDIMSKSKVPAYKKYFMHGTSHHMGLDVHDVSNPQAPLEAGMVLTCEPGIYIPEESLGIRLENDILITTTGNIDLMANIPIEVDEIESLINI